MSLEELVNLGEKLGYVDEELREFINDERKFINEKNEQRK